MQHPSLPSKVRLDQPLAQVFREQHLHCYATAPRPAICFAGPASGRSCWEDRADSDSDDIIKTRALAL